MSWPTGREYLEAAARDSNHPELFVTIAEILFRHDPVGINLEENVDEYSAEAGTILPRLASAESAEDVRRIVRQEFEHWFAGVGRSDERMDAAADEIWQCWRESSLSRSHD